MVQLDHVLIFHAHRLITGANVHCAKEMIFAYKQAVILHNEKWPGHLTYQCQHEKKLRQFVLTESRRWITCPFYQDRMHD